MKFIIGSGFYGGQSEREFSTLWAEILVKSCTIFPQELIVISVGDSQGISNDALRIFDDADWRKPQTINLYGNLGHVGQIISGEKDHAYCGWSMAFLTAAMIAYQNESDYLWIEQDCLAFGPWVQRMYTDMGEADMVFGAKMKTPPYMASAQALVLVRHSFIPTMVMLYLGIGYDSVNCLPETKFAKMEERWPTHIRRLSFGVDRERPIPYDAPVFYAQKLSAEEIATLKEKQLI